MLQVIQPAARRLFCAILAAVQCYNEHFTKFARLSQASPESAPTIFGMTG
jgi:ferric iron reductase protein FhuF